MHLRLCYFIIKVDFMLRSWDSHSYEFLVSCLQEFKVLECLVMFIELYVSSWVWWMYEWWIYDVITSYDVEIGEWICNDVWY